MQKTLSKKYIFHIFLHAYAHISNGERDKPADLIQHTKIVSLLL